MTATEKAMRLELQRCEMKMREAALAYASRRNAKDPDARAIFELEGHLQLAAIDYALAVANAAMFARGEP